MYVRRTSKLSLTSLCIFLWSLLISWSIFWLLILASLAASGSSRPTRSRSPLEPPRHTRQNISETILFSSKRFFPLRAKFRVLTHSTSFCRLLEKEEKLDTKRSGDLKDRGTKSTHFSRFEYIGACNCEESIIKSSKFEDLHFHCVHST